MSKIINLEDKNLAQNCYVFKHSTVCPISFRAADEVKAANNAQSFELPLYWVNVREQRELSNWIAEFYNVKHESPQLILIKNGKAQNNWSHGSIKSSVFEI